MTASDRDDASAQLKKVQKAEDGKRALAEYEAEAASVRAKMARLKELRLARDAAAGGPAAKVKKSTKKKSAAPEKREAGSLSDWLKDRENSGRRN